MTEQMTTLLKSKNYNRLVFLFLAIFGGLGIAAAGSVIPPEFLLVAVMGFPFFLFISTETEWGLILLVFIIYLNLSFVLINYHDIPSIAKIFVPIMFILGLRKALWKGALPEGFKRAVPTLLIFYFVMMLSLLYAADINATVYKLEDYLKDMIIALIIIMTLQRGPILRRTVWALILAGGFLGAFNVFQFLTSTFDNPYWGFAQAGLAHIIGETTDYRIGGPVGSPNAFGHTILLVVPLALERFLHERKLLLRGVAGVICILLILTVIFTYSRSVFLGLVVIGIVTMVIKPPKPMALIGFVVIGMMILPFVPASYTERLTTITEILPGARNNAASEASFRGRLSESTVAWLMFRDNPVFGVGVNNYGEFYLDYSSQLGLDGRRIERSAHNRYLQLLAEQGMVGLFTFLAMVGYVTSQMWYARNLFKNAYFHDYANMSAAIMTGFIAYLCVYYFIDDTHPRYFWLFVGIGFALPDVARNEITALYRKAELFRSFGKPKNAPVTY